MTVPTLRFPEFRAAGEWNEDAFEELVDVIDGDRGINYPKAEEFSSSGYCVFLTAKNVTKNGFKFVEVQFITKEKDEALRKGKLQRADVVLTTRGSVGQFAYYSEDVPYDNMRINSGMVILRIKSKKINADYFYTYSKSEILAAYIDNIAFGNAQQQLTVAEIKKFRLNYPEPEEQQKIADCLSSIDELVTAQTQKVEALKAHKKGLMQQLFPAEGETIPKLRFPEYRDSGAWKERRLGDACERILDGTHFSPKSKSGPRLYLTSKNIQNGEIDLSNISFISEEEHREMYKRCPVKKNDVLLTKDGANTGNCALNSIDYEFSLLSSVAVLRGIPSLLEQRFLYQWVLADRTQKTIQESMSGQAITRITLEKIGNFVILITGIEEQQKIANCLSSIDELITAQTQKLAALKTHKKGLMQQLFPAADEVMG